MDDLAVFRSGALCRWLPPQARTVDEAVLLRRCWALLALDRAGAVQRQQGPAAAQQHRLVHRARLRRQPAAQRAAAKYSQVVHTLTSRIVCHAAAAFMPRAPRAPAKNSAVLFAAGVVQ